MVGSFSLGGLSSLELEEGVEETERLEAVEEDRLRIPPLTTPADDPELSPDPNPVPLLRILPNKGEVVPGLLAELCLLS